MSEASQVPLSRRVRSLAIFPFWLALVAAGTEVLIRYVQKRSQPLVHLSEDFVWMAPLALLTVTLAIVALFALLGRFWSPRRSLLLALLFSASALALNLLMLVPGLAHYAAALLAAGLGIQTTRLVQRRANSVRRLMQRSTIWLIAGWIVGGSLMWMSLRPATAAPAAAVSPHEPLPNVLLITLDTVRAANMSLYGYSRSTTPTIDRFAERGVVFEQAFATAPWTLPSHASMFTGRWPYELSADFATPLDDTHLTLAEYFGGRSYATAGMVGNLQYCGADTGLVRGFDTYEDYPRSLGEIASSSTLVQTVANNFRLRRLIQNDQHLDRVSAEQINRRALSWISAQDGMPFFLFLNYFDAHEPYLPPPPFDRRFGAGRQHGRHSPLHHWLWNPAIGHRKMGNAERQEEIDAYDGSLAYLDYHVGELLNALETRGILDDTLVVITSDHGEEFAEHSVFDHGYSLYRPSVQVPLVMVFPGRTPSARRVAAPVSLRDLASTVVDLLGPSQDTPFPGTSLTRLWRDDRRGPPLESEAVSPAFAEVSRSPGQPDWFPSSKGDMTAVVSQGLRYILNGDGGEELYDLEDDPWEQRNLVSMPNRESALVEARALLARTLNQTGGLSRSP